MCGEAPVTPPAGACSLPLDGSPANCPDPDEVFVRLPRQELKGEVDIWNQNQLHHMQMMFLHNARQDKVESIENRFVTFPSHLHHTGTTCTDQKRRVVINFNYYESNE